MSEKLDDVAKGLGRGDGGGPGDADVTTPAAAAIETLVELAEKPPRTTTPSWGEIPVAAGMG